MTRKNNSMPAADPLQKILDRLAGVRKYPGGYRATCPAAEHRSNKGGGRTLSLSQKDDSGVLIHCHAGCAAAEVLSAIGLGLSDLYPSPSTGGAKKGAWKEWRSLISAADGVQALAFSAALSGDKHDFLLVLDAAADLEQMARAALRAGVAR